MTATMQNKAGNRRRLSPPLAQFVLGVLDGIGAGTPQGAQTTVSARRTCTDCWRRARFTSCRRSWGRWAFRNPAHEMGADPAGRRSSHSVVAFSVPWSVR